MKYFKSIKRIFEILDFKSKFYLLIYLLNMLILNILELFGLGILSLYIGIFTDNTLIYKFPGIIQNYFVSLTYKEVIYQISIIIILLFLFKNSFIFFQNWFSLKLKQRILVKNSEFIFKKLMRLKYLKFYELNKSTITYKVYGEVKRTTNFIFGFANMFKEIVLIIILFSSLLVVNFKISLIVLFASLMLLIIFIFLIKNKLKFVAERINKHNSIMLLSINEMINNYILVNLTNKINFFLKNYINQLNLNIKYSNIKSILQNLPRIVLEVFAVTIIVFLCLLIFNLELDFEDYIPTLTFSALVIVRLIPSLTNMSGHINEIIFSEDSFNNFFENNFKKDEMIEDNYQNNISNNYKNKDLEINFENLSFKYKENNSFILNNITQSFKQDNLIGITGKSGSGKSTLLKLLMGFLSPIKGKIFINNKELFADDKNWQDQIGYMPQKIILNYSFIKNNIAIGEKNSDIDENKILSIVNNSYFKRIINYEKLQNIKIQEGSTNLSGGQIQIIGLARALYKDKKLLILDEPTNNLDFETKKLFQEYLKQIKKNRIIIVVSHDRELLKICDKSYILKKSELSELKVIRT